MYQEGNKAIKNDLDPVIAPEVILHEARAKYYRGCAEVEPDVEKRNSFYTKVETAEEAIKLLCEWFVTPPAPFHTLRDFVGIEYHTNLTGEASEHQNASIKAAVAAFPEAPQEELIVLSVTASGHVVTPDGCVLGWLR